MWIIIMWIGILDTVIVLPNGLFTPMENVINEIIQPLNHRQRLWETLWKCLCYFLVQNNTLVSYAKQSVVSKGSFGIKVLFWSCFILCKTELELWLYGFALILEFTQEVREWTLSWNTLPWSTQCDRAWTDQKIAALTDQLQVICELLRLIFKA